MIKIINSLPNSNVLVTHLYAIVMFSLTSHPSSVEKKWLKIHRWSSAYRLLSARVMLPYPVQTACRYYCSDKPNAQVVAVYPVGQNDDL